MLTKITEGVEKQPLAWVSRNDSQINTIELTHQELQSLPIRKKQGGQFWNCDPKNSCDSENKKSAPPQLSADTHEVSD